MSDWMQANQRYLNGHLARIRARLEAHSDPQAVSSAPEIAPVESDTPAALDTLCTLFDLSAFERDVLVLCAGVEFDARFGSLCASAQADSERSYPTFSLALAALENPHWSALTPNGALRYWRLLHLVENRPVVYSPLRIDERILHYLVGLNSLDEYLAPYLQSVRWDHDLPSPHEHLARLLASSLSDVEPVDQQTTIVQLCGDSANARSLIAARAAALLEHDLYCLAAEDVPTTLEGIQKLVRLWERETLLANRILLIDCERLNAQATEQEQTVYQLLSRMRAPVVLSVSERRAHSNLLMLTLDVERLSSGEQRDLWQTAFGDGVSLDGQLDLILAQFDLDVKDVYAVAASAQVDPKRSLWGISRTQARTHMDDLARRIEPAATWDDLILPESQKQILRDIAVHVRQRVRVYETWGFNTKGKRGLGISALFFGGSGTGKTMAAEVLAHELELDLYQIDLSAVMSKWIGETEKNLSRVFRAAEKGGAILLFDEADSLFGKRTETKDSHDRYANLEVSYLLQRMEAYRGLSILTTNMKDNLDAAFLRRIRFLVQFPFPDAAQRAEIWRHVFPTQMPTQNLNAERLAQLNVSGGNIRNIALGAAFAAADESKPVQMSHLLRAARSEYAKLGKPLVDAEIRGWDAD